MSVHQNQSSFSTNYGQLVEHYSQMSTTALTK